jgi:hypothetical protein
MFIAYDDGLTKVDKKWSSIIALYLEINFVQFIGFWRKL